jgi:hypothetical protein
MFHFLSNSELTIWLYKYILLFDQLSYFLRRDNGMVVYYNHMRHLYVRPVLSLEMLPQTLPPLGAKDRVPFPLLWNAWLMQETAPTAWIYMYPCLLQCKCIYLLLKGNDLLNDILIKYWIMLIIKAVWYFCYIAYDQDNVVANSNNSRLLRVGLFLT